MNPWVWAVVGLGSVALLLALIWLWRELCRLAGKVNAALDRGAR